MTRTITVTKLIAATAQSHITKSNSDSVTA